MSHRTRNERHDRDDRHSRRSRQWLGREGEARAARFLETRGYRIVARNVRADRVEIDLIARRGGLLVFVEVKSRRAARHGEAAEAVDARKQGRLRHGAHAWLASNPSLARQTRTRRFDVVTCLYAEVFDGSDDDGRAEERGAPERPRWSIEHWEAAF